MSRSRKWRPSLLQLEQGFLVLSNQPMVPYLVVLSQLEDLFLEHLPSKLRNHYSEHQLTKLLPRRKKKRLQRRSKKQKCSKLHQVVLLEVNQSLNQNQQEVYSQVVHFSVTNRSQAMIKWCSNQLQEGHLEEWSCLRRKKSNNPQSSQVRYSVVLQHQEVCLVT